MIEISIALRQVRNSSFKTCLLLHFSFVHSSLNKTRTPSNGIYSMNNGITSALITLSWNILILNSDCEECASDVNVH